MPRRLEKRLQHCAPTRPLARPSLPNLRQAREAVHGRMFAGSTVEASFMQPQAFMDAIVPPPTPLPAAPEAALAAQPAAVPAADPAAAAAAGAEAAPLPAEAEAPAPLPEGA